jgi:ribosomal protein L37E
MKEKQICCSECGSTNLIKNKNLFICSECGLSSSKIKYKEGETLSEAICWGGLALGIVGPLIKV